MGEARAHEVDSSHGSGFACPLQNYDSVCVRDFLVSGRVKKKFTVGARIDGFEIFGLEIQHIAVTSVEQSCKRFLTSDQDM